VPDEPGRKRSIRALLETDGGHTVVVNSCAVTAQAVSQSRRAVRRLRRDHPEARLIVTGCAATIDASGFAAMDEVDGVIPNSAKLDPARWQVPAPPPRAPSAHHTRAFVPVQNGCDHACTFCVIPQGRGASRSAPVADVLRTVESHLALGVHEVVLSGIDLTSWGADLPGSRASANWSPRSCAPSRNCRACASPRWTGWKSTRPCSPCSAKTRA
jgi:threonylcarbamoyladenosine tRNA methylthiotransferase MtaB